MWNLLFLFAGLMFLILLIVIFFTKQTVDSVENRIFKLFIITNLIEYFIEIPLQILVRTLGINSILINVFARIYIIFIFLIFSVFTIYTYYISLKGEKEAKKISAFKIAFVIYVLVNILVFAILPLEKHYDGIRMYAYGIVVDYLKIQLSIYMIFWIVRLIYNIKSIFAKKYVPVFAIIVLIIANVVLQNYDPSILISTLTATFICYTMYFTIENPDMKLINELEVAREQADKANHAKTDFLSSMSHEIRTPLNAIVGFSDCIMDAKSLGEAQENAKDIVNASQTLLEIVNGILDISKIEAGKIEIVNSKYNALETFEELAKLITPKMREKGLDFSYTIAPDLPTTLFGDHANIKKIVTNLLSNACKYTDRGFVHYEVNCVNTKDVSKLIISVEDSGRGIKKDSVDKMFTKFQRLDEDRNTTIEGTGLGLAITKQLVELMGGRIILHTVYGQGSKFTVVLNQKITEADAVTTKKVKTTLDLNNVRILMVDDTPLNLKVACKLLEKYNANHIITCNSGFECLDRITKGEEYDVILLDDMMPKMSGVQTLQKLKELPDFNIPTVALTANAISGMREKYLADGFDDYLAKPIEKNQLIQVLNQVLGRSATEDISVNEVVKADENIRSEEIPNVEDQNKAEAERKNNSDIIPVEDNIEEMLGDKVEMGYKDEVVTTPVIETLEEVSEVETIPVVSTVPMTNIGPIPEIPNMPKEYDRDYLESNGVNVDHALELLGDMDMYNMTISDFVNDVESKWNRIVEYKNSNNMPDYAIEVHSLKSDCKYLGFMTLADIAYEHELKSKENDSVFVNDNFERLETEYKKVLEIAKTYAEHNKVEG